MKPEKKFQKEKDRNKMYFAPVGLSEKFDIGSFYNMDRKFVTFVTDGGVRFKMLLNKFASMKDVNQEVVDDIKIKMIEK